MNTALRIVFACASIHDGGHCIDCQRKVEQTLTVLADKAIKPAAQELQQ